MARRIQGYDRWAASGSRSEQFSANGCATYQRNELVEGSSAFHGETVSLRDLTVPILCIGASKDDIVPPASARALIEAAGSTDKQFLELEGGHISVIAGRRAKQQVWPALLQWLKDHD